MSDLPPPSGQPAQLPAPEPADQVESTANGCLGALLIGVGALFVVAGIVTVEWQSILFGVIVGLCGLYLAGKATDTQPAPKVNVASTAGPVKLQGGAEQEVVGEFAYQPAFSGRIPVDRALTIGVLSEHHSAAVRSDRTLRPWSLFSHPSLQPWSNQWSNSCSIGSFDVMGTVQQKRRNPHDGGGFVRFEQLRCSSMRRGWVSVAYRVQWLYFGV